MARRRRRDYDEIHNYVERIEDVLLSESSWSTSDSECSGCLHLSKESIKSDSCAGAIELSTLTAADHTFDINCNNCKANHDPGESVGPSYKSFGWQRLPIDASSNLTSRISAAGVRCSTPNLNKDILAGTVMLQQLSLLAAGAQPWHHNVCTAHARKFAYAATLVIYVYEVEEGCSEWQLCSILSEHCKTITCLDWHPSNEDILASSSLDQRVCIWSVSRQSILCAISICKVPIITAWYIGQRDLLSFTTENGPIQLWNYIENGEPYPFREEYGYSNGVLLYRWHPTVAGRLVVGHNDGKLTIYKKDVGKIRHSNLPEGFDDETGPKSLVSVEWDTCSPDYLLVAYRTGALWLIDTNTMKIITKYILPGSASVGSLAWLPDAPGLFVSGDSEKGILRLWTVAKQTPVENYVLKDTGFHALCATRTVNNLNSSQESSVVDESKLDMFAEKKGFMIPQVSIVTLFKDGGVGLYHLKRKQWIFHREHGHTETIFDCCFKPEDSDLLATGSFDGSIKIWRIDKMETVITLPNCDTIIYSLSWAPADLNCIAAGTSSGEVFLWSIGKDKILQEIRSHRDKKVFCVSWNQKDSRRIASSGESGSCFVHQVNGVMLQEYKHPGPVYGCDWRDENTLATGCEDGRIRIFDVSKQRKEPYIELKAHMKKVFRVKWNPVYEDILCSGSDDTSVRIWSVSKAQCLAILVGHSDNVRGLAWCPEVPFLLVSGSWDRTMRVWDTRNCTCLDVVLDHGADVYGLSIHPIRPFLLASCSRDSTVRLWSLSSFVAPLQLKVLANHPISEIIADKGIQSTLNSNMILRGIRAEHLETSLEKVENTNRHNRTLKLFADLFCADVNARNLWDLIYVIQGHADISTLSPDYTNSIVHHSHLMKCAVASAAEKELEIEVNQSKSLTNRKHTALENQEALATKYLSYGALQQYCELMVRLNQWDHALAISPAVSVDYWRDLLQRHADQLVADDNEACVPYLLASKDADKLIHFHISRGHLNKAFAACVALSKPNKPSKKGPAPLVPDLPPRTAQTNGIPSPDGRIVECSKVIAEWHLKRGSPITAACALLAVDHIEGALALLLRGHELELVVTVGRLLQSSFEQQNEDLSFIEKQISTAVRYLVYRATRLSMWELAIDLANTLLEGEEKLILQSEVLVSFNGSEQDKISLHKYAGFPPPSESYQLASGSIVNQILYLLISNEPQRGFTRGLDYIKETVCKNQLDDINVWTILRLMQMVSLTIGGSWEVASEEKYNFLALSAYLGSVKAAALNYSSIVPYLLLHTSHIMEKYKSAEMAFLNGLVYDARMRWENGEKYISCNLGDVETTWVDKGITRVNGSHLPRHSDSHMCCITRLIIKGPGYFLENGESVMGFNDALMWAKVHPYSPIGTGARLNPF